MWRHKIDVSSGSTLFAIHIQQFLDTLASTEIALFKFGKGLKWVEVSEFFG